MKSSQWVRVAMVGVICGMATAASAAMEAVIGRVTERDGLKLTIEQRNGRTKQVKLDKKTPVVAVPRVTAPLIDRIRVDSKVSIMLKDGKPVVVQIVEVPK